MKEIDNKYFYQSEQTNWKDRQILDDTGDIQAWYHGVNATATRNCQGSRGNLISGPSENNQNLK